MKRFLLTATLLAAASGAAFAAAAPSNNSRDFVKKAAVTDMFEVESSKLALEKSKNEAIRNFATQMIEDHTKSTGDLKDALGEAELDADKLLPKDLDAKHAGLMDRLKAAEGTAFENLYLMAQNDGHTAAVQLFSAYSKTGDNPKLKAFAGKTLPVIEGHKDHVKNLKPGS